MKDDLITRLDTLAKVLESSGLIDEHYNPGAYATILDAIKALAEPEHPVQHGCRMVLGVLRCGGDRSKER